MDAHFGGVEFAVVKLKNLQSRLEIGLWLTQLHLDGTQEVHVWRRQIHAQQREIHLQTENIWLHSLMFVFMKMKRAELTSLWLLVSGS